MKNILIILALCCTCMVTATEYTPSSLPNPHLADATDYVCNPDGILSSQAEATINAISNRLNRQYEVELVTIAIEAFDEWHYDAFEFCQELGNQWGIGTADVDRGMIIFLATSSRDIRLHTGKGLEGILTDATCTDIREEMSKYLAEAAWDEGMTLGAERIEQELNQPAAQSELLLGWRPKQGPSNGWFYYFMLAFVALIVCACEVYRSMQHTAGSRTKRYKYLTGPGSMLLKTMAIFFPLPVALFYWYCKKRLFEQVRTEPMPCPHCGQMMKLLTEQEEDDFLSKTQQTEETLHVTDYDVFLCPDCGHKIVLAYDNDGVKKKYERCKQCGAFAAAMAAERVLVEASTTHGGEGIRTHRCKHCGHQWDEVYHIPKVVLPAGGYIGGVPSGRGGFASGGFGGSSFGGGSFAGGGSGGHF